MKPKAQQMPADDESVCVYVIIFICLFYAFYSFIFLPFLSHNSLWLAKETTRTSN